MSDSSLKLKRVESPDRKVLFYFDEVTSSSILLLKTALQLGSPKAEWQSFLWFQIPSARKICVTVTFQRAYEVGKPQPSTASVYSYYEPGTIC